MVEDEKVMDTNRYKLIIFDKDGTLVRHKAGKTFINKPADQEMIPGRAEACAFLRKCGYELAVASNQGGVAFGHMSFDDMVLIMADVAIAIKAVCLRACPDHPDGTVAPFNKASTYRKPSPGMLLSIMEERGMSKADTLYVGDRMEDFEAASNADVSFMRADEFFSMIEHVMHTPTDQWEAPDEDKGEGYLGE